MGEFVVSTVVRPQWFAAVIRMQWMTTAFASSTRADRPRDYVAREVSQDTGAPI